MINTAIRYTAEFKQTLIDLHHKRHSFKEPHEEYGNSLDTIRKWVHVATIVAIDDRGVAMINEQDKQLRKENHCLKEEVDILKRAAVLLAKCLFVAAMRSLFCDSGPTDPGIPNHHHSQLQNYQSIRLVGISKRSTYLS